MQICMYTYFRRRWCVLGLGRLPVDFCQVVLLTPRGHSLKEIDLWSSLQEQPKYEAWVSCCHPRQNGGGIRNKNVRFCCSFRGMELGDLWVDGNYSSTRCLRKGYLLRTMYAYLIDMLKAQNVCESFSMWKMFATFFQKVSDFFYFVHHCSSQVWILHNFSVTQILREIKIC